MQVLITGPCELGALRRHLNDGAEGLPAGMPGVPVYSLVTELLQRDHKVTLVTLDGGVQDEVRFHGGSLRVRVGPYRAGGRARDYFRAERGYVSRAIAQEQADLVHAHWTYEYALGAIAAQRATLVTVHDWAPAILRFHVHPYRAVRLVMQFDTFRRRPAMSVVSPYLMERVQRLPRQRAVRLIPNGIADALFRPPLDPGSPLPESGTPLVVAVNHGWDSRKNVAQLLSCFPRVLEAVPDARLALIGAGYGVGEAAQVWAEAHGLVTNVEFVGRLSNAEAVKWIREATVFAHVSREESFGLVLVEAMANHTPVLGGADSGGVPWVLDYGLAGELCDVRRPPAIANGLILLLTSPERRRKFADRGYARADRNFRMSQVVEQYLDQYGALLTS